MNVSTVQMPREIAMAKLRTVRKVLRRRADAEYQALERAYSALQDGTPLLELRQSIALGGYDAKGRPKIAIARADRRKVFVESRRANDPIVFDSSRAATDNWSRAPRGSTLRVEIESLAPAGERGWTLVPMIPPEVRVDHPSSSDRERFILWEVEEWKDQRLGLQPPRDPMLIEPLGGDLYVVRAHWDLTDLERMIMRGRE